MFRFVFSALWPSVHNQQIPNNWWIIRTFLGFPVSSTGKEFTCSAGDWFDSEVRNIPCRKDRLPAPVFLGFPGGSDGKESTCSVGYLGSTPGLGRSPGGGNGNPLWYSCLENPMDRGAWWATVHGVAKSQPWWKWLSTHAHTVHIWFSIFSPSMF